MEDVRRLPVGEDNEIAVTLDDLAREGARRMIATALKAEADEYVERYADERDQDGKRLVVRNGRARERSVTVGSGTVAVHAPRVNDKRVDEQTAERRRFSSRILPAYARRSPKTPPGCRGRRSAGCARTGRASTSASGPARCAFTATRICSSTACTSRSGSARTTGSACS